MLVRLSGPSLAGLLPSALAAAQERHPLLRARIAGPPSRPRFVVRTAAEASGAAPDGTAAEASGAAPDGTAAEASGAAPDGTAAEASTAAGGEPGPIPLRVVPSPDPDAAYAVVEEEMNAPFDPARGPLARVTYLTGSVQAPDGAPGGASDATPGTSPTSDLVLTLHHAIADGTSAANLVHELLRWCDARIAGDSPPSFGPAVMPPPLTDLLPAGLLGIRGPVRSLALVARQGRDEVTYRLGSRGRRRPIPPLGRAVTRPLSLDRDQTASLVDRARRLRLTLPSLLSAALLWQASAVLYQGRRTAMRAVVWVDLRPYLNPPVPDEALGCYVSMLRFPVTVDPRTGFAALAAEVAGQIERAARRGDRLPAALLSPALARVAIRAPVGRLGTTALSYATTPGIKQSYGPVQVREVRGFVSNIRLGAELAAACGVVQGALWLNLLYLDSDFDAVTATTIGDGLRSALREFADA